MNEGSTKVFVSLDGTEQQDFVLARAIKVAANNGAKLIIGHVIDSTALESAGSYPVDLVNGLEEAFKNSIAKQLEEAKANPDIPEVEVMIRAGRIRETLKDEMLDVVKPDLVLCGARGLRSLASTSCLMEKWRAAPFGAARFVWGDTFLLWGIHLSPHSCVHVREHSANCLSYVHVREHCRPHRKTARLLEILELVG